jgi:hypothetical protein
MEKNQIDKEFEDTFKGKFDNIKLESDCNESEETIEELTSSSSSGSFVGPALTIKKKDLVNEITDSSSSGSYESRFFASPNKKRATGLKNYVKYWNKKGMDKAMELDFDKISKLSRSKNHEHGYPLQGQLGMKALKPLREGKEDMKSLSTKIFSFFRKNLIDKSIANEIVNILIDTGYKNNIKKSLVKVSKYLEYENLKPTFIDKINNIILSTIEKEDYIMAKSENDYLTENTKKAIAKIAKQRNLSESLIYDLIKENIQSMPVLYPFILNHGKQFEEYNDYAQSDCGCGSKETEVYDNEYETYEDDDYELYDDFEDEKDMVYGYEDEQEDEQEEDKDKINYGVYTKGELMEAFKFKKSNKTHASSMGKSEKKNVKIFPDEIEDSQFPVNSTVENDIFKDTDVQEYVRKMGKMNTKNNKFHKDQLLDFASQSQESIIYDVEPTKEQKKFMRLNTMMKDTKAGKDLEKFGDERREMFKKQRRSKFYYA